MGAELLASLQATLPGVTWVDVEAELCAVRAQKSPAEFEVIRYAYRIAETGFRAACEAIAPGVTERAVAARNRCGHAPAGAEGTGIDTIVASGPNTHHPGPLHVPYPNSA